MFAPLLLTLALAPIDSGGLAEAALAPLNPLVGAWRGVAQPRRGSAAGAWREEGDWVWDFSRPRAPALVFAATGGTEPRTLRVDPAAGGFAATPAGATLTAGDERATLRVLGPDRFTLLVERRRTPTGRFRRVYEVGYTRDGVTLAERGLGGPECVVTGGLGTIPVTHAGDTYFVCCTGCVAAFEADPAGVVADYRATRAAADAAKHAGE